MPKEIINEDFEIPAHLQEEDTGNEVEIEVVDDTPDEDRGRKPLNTQESEDHEEELENYSEKVQKRINQINHKYHDERRAKEALERQNAEAIRIAQSILEENNKLKETLYWGQQAYTQEAEAKIEMADRKAHV